MAKERIYKALPWPLQNAACNWYGWKEKRLRMNKQFESYLAWLKSLEYLGPDVIREYQDSNVSEVVDFASKHIPFYKNRLADFGLISSQINSIDDLSKLPLLSKEDVIKNKCDLLSVGVSRKSLVRSHTSGTTGTALEFYKTPEAIAFQWAVWWRHRARFGFGPGDWHVNYTARPVVPLEQAAPPYWRMDYFRKQIIVSAVHLNKKNKVEVIAEKIRQSGAHFLTGYCSQIAQFASFVDSSDAVDLGDLDCVFLGAENADDAQIELIKRVTGATVTDQYGFAEGCGNASRCEYGNYHEDWEFGVLECLDPVVNPDGSRTGRIVATGFADYAFPFIRYDVGDTGTWAPEDYRCPCGRSSKVLWQIDGRNEDYVVTPEGNRVRRWDYLFKDTRSIRQAQIVQREYGAIVIRIVPRGAVSEEDFRKVRSTVREWISSGLDVEFDVVDELARSASGKFKPVVSELDTKASK